MDNATFKPSTAKRPKTAQKDNDDSALPMHALELNKSYYAQLGTVANSILEHKMLKKLRSANAPDGRLPAFSQDEIAKNMSAGHAYSCLGSAAWLDEHYSPVQAPIKQ